MDALKTLMLEGQFFILHTKLVVRDDKGAEHDVSSALEGLEGRQVRLAVMHVPPDGIKPDEWGGGCCAWENSGHCPAGHHEDPQRVLVFTCDGVLQKAEPEGASQSQAWALHKFDGVLQRVPLTMMPGHYGRMVGATTDAVERMRDKLANLGPDQQVEALMGEAGDLKEMLERLRKATGSK